MINWVHTRDEIAKLLREKVTIVHNFPRLEKDHHIGRWRKLMSDTKEINAWTILRSSMVNSFGTCQQIYTTTNVMLVGLLQHNDETASQDVFDNTIDTVLETFFKHHKLDDSIDIQGPAQLQLEELRQVADTPVHYCEVTIQVQQTVHT